MNEMIKFSIRETYRSHFVFDRIFGVILLISSRIFKVLILKKFKIPIVLKKIIT